MKILPDAAISDEIVCGFIGYACGSGRLGSGHDSDKRYKRDKVLPQPAGAPLSYMEYGKYEKQYRNTAGTSCLI